MRVIQTPNLKYEGERAEIHRTMNKADNIYENDKRAVVLIKELLEFYYLQWNSNNLLIKTAAHFGVWIKIIEYHR